MLERAPLGLRSREIGVRRHFASEPPRPRSRLRAQTTMREWRRCCLNAHRSKSRNQPLILTRPRIFMKSGCEFLALILYKVEFLNENSPWREQEGTGSEARCFFGATADLAPTVRAALSPSRTSASTPTPQASRSRRCRSLSMYGPLQAAGIVAAVGCLAHWAGNHRRPAQQHSHRRRHTSSTDTSF